MNTEDSDSQKSNGNAGQVTLQQAVSSQPEELRRLYVDCEMSRRAIAEKWDVSPDRVKALRNKHGVMRKDELQFSKEELKEHYVRQQLSLKDTANNLDSHVNAIRRHIEYYGITKKRTQSADISGKAHFHARSDGYEQWGTNNHTFLVHRLVAVAEWGFDEVCDKHVHHLNGVPWDNRAENLHLIDSRKHGAIHLDEITHWLERAPDGVVSNALRTIGYEAAADAVLSE